MAIEAIHDSKYFGTVKSFQYGRDFHMAPICNITADDTMDGALASLGSSVFYLTSVQEEAVRNLLFDGSVGVLEPIAMAQFVVYRSQHPDAVLFYNFRATLDGMELIPSIVRSKNKVVDEIIKENITR